MSLSNTISTVERELRDVRDWIGKARMYGDASDSISAAQYARNAESALRNLESAVQTLIREAKKLKRAAE